MLKAGPGNALRAAAAARLVAKHRGWLTSRDTGEAVAHCKASVDAPIRVPGHAIGARMLH